MVWRAFVYVVLFGCFSASLELGDNSVIEKLEKAINQTNEAYNETIKENERLEEQLANLTKIYSDKILDMRIEERNTSLAIEDLIQNLQNASADILTLEFELEFLRLELERITAEDKKLALAISTIKRELEAYRLDNTSGDFILCEQYQNVAKAGSVHVVSLMSIEDSNIEKQILEAKLAQAKEALWAAQDKMNQIEKDTIDQKANLEIEVERLQKLITRDGLNEKKLEDDLKKARADIKELVNQIAQVTAEIILGTGEVSNKWNTITGLKLEYDSYRSNIDCYVWLREWAFNDIQSEDKEAVTE